MSERNGSIEILRIIGAGAIVWFHLALPGGWAAFAALHVFVILAVYFGISAPGPRAFRRFLLPWMIWSAIYGAAKIAQAVINKEPFAQEFAPWMVLTGASLHLWFLPFCFGVLALARLSGPLRPWQPPLLMLVSLALMRLAPLPIPFGQWVHVLPAAALGLWMTTSRHPLLPLALTTAGATVLWFGGAGKGIEQTAIASAACLIAFALPMAAPGPLRALAGLSFGIYLAHPLALALILLLIPAAEVSGPGLFVATLSLSTVMVLALKRLVPQIV